MKWFADFEHYVNNEVKDCSVLSDPSRLYNADESGFSFCSNTGKVIGYKGAPVVYNYGNSSEQQLTVLACASASGHFCPPMIVYPEQRFGFEPLNEFEDAHMGRSESGWMDSDLFCHWLLTCSIPALESRCVKKARDPISGWAFHAPVFGGVQYLCGKWQRTVLPSGAQLPYHAAP